MGGLEDFRGRLNIYTCRACGSHIVTKDVDDGVTPFSLPSSEWCPRKCRSIPSILVRPMPASMNSSMYRVFDQNMRPDAEWYRPSETEQMALSDWEREHVKKGGLLIRRAA